MAKRYSKIGKLWNTQGSLIEDPPFKVLLEKIPNLSVELSSDKSELEEEEENSEAYVSCRVLISQKEKRAEIY